MLFNSYHFLFLFLPAVLAGVAVLGRLGFSRMLVAWLGVASLVFYGVDYPQFLPVILGSVLGNYALGTALGRCAHKTCRKVLLTGGVAGNLLALGYFKYTHFLLQSANDWLGTAYALPAIALPIGISFYTFTQIAYLADQYKKPHTYRFWDYLLFVSFFPHLVAGPVLLHRQVIPQFEAGRLGRPSPRRLAAAVVFFSVGLAKKVLIADSISPYVGMLFSAAPVLTAPEAWAGALLYTLQLYFDFSGYCDMAVGLALMLNVRIPINFNAPYRATSMIAFWQRWHISLSRFLRDYLYIPLGGNRKGELRRYLNVAVTMLLGGIWHGAGWTFVIWGAIHAAAIVVNHAWRGMRAKRAVSHWAGWCLTMLVVVQAWVFFRAPDVGYALEMTKAMYGARGWGLSGVIADVQAQKAVLFWLLAGWGILFFAPRTQALAIMRGPRYTVAVYAALLLVLSVLNFSKVSEFLYFQF